MNERAGARDGAARMSHPLLGANAKTLWSILRAAGSVRREAVPLVGAMIGSALARMPFSLAERAWTGLRMRGRESPAPVFIVGHWRSGTTHLYNALSHDPRFGYVTPLATGMPWDFLLLGSALRPVLERFVPRERLIDRVPVTPDAPQEDEIALASMQTLSFYHGIYFPEHLDEWFDRGVFFDGATPREVQRWCACMRYFVAKLALAQPGRRLLIKNPVYSARIARLRELWPQARFIHIHRNPYVVFQSTRNFYRSLLPAFALQAHDPEMIDELILSRYTRMMRILLDDMAEVPPNRGIEIGFDEFKREPIIMIEHIYRTLELDGFAEARPAFAEYLATLDDYRKNCYTFPQADNERVMQRWGRFIERWGYEPPNDEKS